MCTHTTLDTLKDLVLKKEIAGNLRELPELLGALVRSFAYPYGRVSEAAAHTVRDAGYPCAATCQGGAVPPGTDPCALLCLGVNGACAAARLARTLALAAAPARWTDLCRNLGRRAMARWRLSAA